MRLPPRGYRSRMSQHERSLHALAFGGAAAAYDEHRPDYAQAAVRWALEPAPGPRSRSTSAPEPAS